MTTVEGPPATTPTVDTITTSAPSKSTPSVPLTTTSSPPITTVIPPPPPTTSVSTSPPPVVTPSPTPTPTLNDNSTSGGDVVTITQTSTSTFQPSSTSTSPPTLTSPIPTTTTSPPIVGNNLPSTSGSSGLPKGSTIAIAVVVPVAVIALLAILAFFFWRRNHDKKALLAARKGEIEDYGFDPNAGVGGVPSAAATSPVGPAAAATAVGTSPEMRQTSYGEDDADGYRGWGPTSSNSKRPSWLPSGAAAETTGATAGATTGATGGYYSHHRSDSNGGYERYPPQHGDNNYYYPDEPVDHHAGAPQSYDRYGSSDLQRPPSNASSRYSTVSNDENAGRDHPGGSRLQQNTGIQNPVGRTGGRTGRSTTGKGIGSYEDPEDGGHGGRYDAVNF